MANAKFYSSEIFCALEHLHSMGVVHLDILLSRNVHILITNFDCSNDTTFRNCPPRLTDYRGNRAFKAPDVSIKTRISCKADVWNFGALLAGMTDG